MQEDGVDHGKSCRCGADAQRERQDGDRGETGIAAELAKSKTKILNEPLSPTPSPHFPACLLRAGDIAEPAHGREAGLLPRHAGFEILLLLHFEVRANLLVQVAGRLVPAKQRSDLR